MLRHCVRKSVSPEREIFKMLGQLNGTCVVKIILLCLMLLVLLNSATGEDCIVAHYNNFDPAFRDTPSCNYRKRTSMRAALDCFPVFYFPNLSQRSRNDIHQVHFGELKHMAAIGWTRLENKIDYLCGGSLISRKFVLTAARCRADNNNITPDTVRLGDTNLEGAEGDELAQQIAIARFIAHPMYRGSRDEFDIAIVELQKEVAYSRAVCIACLWREEEVPRENMEAILVVATGSGEALSSGFKRVGVIDHGKSDGTGRTPDNRRHRPDGLRKNQFCAAGTTVDACEGDSGGPIGVKRLDTKGKVYNVVVGIASFGTLASVGSTGVYTKVSSSINWIEQVTNRSFVYEKCRSYECEERSKEEIPITDIDMLYTSKLLWDEADSSTPRGCGTTLIDDQYFLTSAACVTSSKGHPKFVVIERFPQMWKVSVTDVYVSPKYRPGRPENNIALIKIAKFVNTEWFTPYCLWNKKIDGEWDSPLFKAFGDASDIVVEGFPAKRCDLQNTTASDVVCFTNSINLIPGVCTMDYGGPVVSLTNIEPLAAYEIMKLGVPANDWKRYSPLVVYGLVSDLTKDCGSNLYMTDVTPHIDWIEAIIIHRRERFHIFSD